MTVRVPANLGALYQRARGQVLHGADRALDLGDDRLGLALDRLYDADRSALLTAVVLAVGKCFAVKFEELHNDSTSIRFCGQYRAQPETVRGQRPARIVFGFSKDHRPDLKQLLFILTTAEDGGVPVQFRVADSKLCSHENLDTIARAGGRFVTVLPRSRQEDRQFRKRIQTTTPPWELVWDRPDPRGRGGPRDQWYLYRDPIGSMEAWPIVWVWSKLLTGHQRASRQRRIDAAVAALTALRDRIAGFRG